jgi:hypothetical protein
MDRENGQRGWLPVARGVGERGDIYGPAAQRRGIGRSSEGRGVGADGCGSAAVHGEAGEVGDGEWLVEAWTYAAECQIARARSWPWVESS